MFHEEAEQFRFFVIEGKAPRDVTNQGDTAQCVIFPLPFPDVMQKPSEVENPPVFYLQEEILQPKVRNGFILLLFHPMQLVDRSQKMLIHGIEVIDIVLYSMAHSHEFR
jgi:hypothetical protein